VVKTTPVASFVNRRDAPLIAAPDESVTLPEMLPPRDDWADAGRPRINPSTMSADRAPRKILSSITFLLTHPRL
jgi:hypothetical protein